MFKDYNLTAFNMGKVFLNKCVDVIINEVENSYLGRYDWK